MIPILKFLIRVIRVHPRPTVLLICTSLLLSNFANPIPSAAQTNMIYADALSSGWDLWPWADQVDLNAASPTHSGSKSIAVTFGAWQGFTLHKAGVNTLGLTDFHFFIHGGSAGGQHIDVYLSLSVNGADQQGPSVAAPIPSANAWSEVNLPLTTLNPQNAVVTGINFQGASSNSQPAFYLDDLSLDSDEDPNAPQISNLSLLPRAVYPDGVSEVIVKAAVSDPQGRADILSVTLDSGLSVVEGALSVVEAGSLALSDDGAHNDGQANDGVYGTVFTVAAGTPPGEYMLLLKAQDQAGHQVSMPLGALVVLESPGGTIPASLSPRVSASSHPRVSSSLSLPNYIAWGSNAWSESAAQDWQANSGVPWNYVYQYITYDWYADGNGAGWGGNFVGRFVNQAWDKGYIPMVTVYMMLGLPPECGEGGACYATKLQNATAVQIYLAAIHEAARQAAGDQPVIFNLEPDFYGYMQQLSNNDSRPAGVQPDDPASYPVALNQSGYANNLTGFGRFLVDSIHTTAPNALVAPMASMWATNQGPDRVTAPEAVDMGRRTAAFIDAMGGAQADLLVVEWSDRDALAVDRPLWDPADLELPRHSRAILWENALSHAAGKRLLLWQVPVGNMSQNNTHNHYQDNHTAYAFSHPRELFDAGVIGVLFGGGAEYMTGVETDGGFVAAQGAIAYAAPAAPTGLIRTAQNGAQATLHWDEFAEPDRWGTRVEYQFMPSGSKSVIDARRKTTFDLLLPVAGEWRIDLVAYDAMNNASAPSGSITVITSTDAGRVFIPFVEK